MDWHYRWNAMKPFLRGWVARWRVRKMRHAEAESEDKHIRYSKQTNNMTAPLGMTWEEFMNVPVEDLPGLYEKILENKKKIFRQA